MRHHGTAAREATRHHAPSWVAKKLARKIIGVVVVTPTKNNTFGEARILHAPNIVSPHATSCARKYMLTCLPCEAWNWPVSGLDFQSFVRTRFLTIFEDSKDKMKLDMKGRDSYQKRPSHGRNWPKPVYKVGCLADKLENAFSLRVSASKSHQTSQSYSKYTPKHDLLGSKGFSNITFVGNGENSSEESWNNGDHCAVR